MKVRMSDTINRFEVIDADGKQVFVSEGVSVELVCQDKGRTLKALLKPGWKDVKKESGWLGKLLSREKAR